MRFSTHRVRGEFRPAVERPKDRALIDLAAANVAASLQALIEGGASLLQHARVLLDDPLAPLLPNESQRMAPIPVPKRNLFCVGKNYRDHAKEFGRSGFDSGAKGGDEVPDAPIIFSKPPSSVIGDGEAIPYDNDPTETIDYEGELAVVIGKGGSRISEQAAFDHVFGYTIVNDVTARELQKIHKQWLLGKGPDGFCPMGPVIVSADEISDIGSLRLTTHVNGEKRQDALVEDLIFSIPRLIATISRVITLQPGDIIATGTPVGVGIGFNPPRYLRRGDRVRIEVTGIGALENIVR